jgi:glycosyltransferase involved in cell wall biosynthesis
MTKPRVAYIVRQYPLLCETYIQTEIDLLSERFEIKVFSEMDPESGHLNDSPTAFVTVPDYESTIAAVREFEPDLMHGHWMIQMPRLHRLATELQIPYTMRGHSFDVIPSPYMKWWFDLAPQLMPQVSASGLCLGILTLPFGREIIERWGMREDQVVDYFPVVDVERFMDPSPNGEGVMNLGACVPKKKIGDYLLLARMCDGIDFDYYPIGYNFEQIKTRNEELGSPVAIRDPIPHSQMPGVYKAHGWLVYTADTRLRNIGWPMSVAEAQASGCGVIVANVRPDLAEYVGEAGYLYDSLEEIRDIIRQPFPDEKREMGFELAKRCDARANLHQLTDLWEPVLGATPA